MTLSLSRKPLAPAAREIDSLYTALTMPHWRGVDARFTRRAFDARNGQDIAPASQALSAATFLPQGAMLAAHHNHSPLIPETHLQGQQQHGGHRSLDSADDALSVFSARR